MNWPVLYLHLMFLVWSLCTYDASTGLATRTTDQETIFADIQNVPHININVQSGGAPIVIPTMGGPPSAPSPFGPDPSAPHTSAPHQDDSLTENDIVAITQKELAHALAATRHHTTNPGLAESPENTQPNPVDKEPIVHKEEASNKQEPQEDHEPNVTHEEVAQEHAKQPEVVDPKPPHRSKSSTLLKTPKNARRANKILKEAVVNGALVKDALADGQKHIPLDATFNYSDLAK